MPPSAKLVLTVLLVAITTLVLGASKVDNGEVDARWWRGGVDDLGRRLIARRDGVFRPRVKALVACTSGVLLAVIWLVL